MESHVLARLRVDANDMLRLGHDIQRPLRRYDPNASIQLTKAPNQKDIKKGHNQGTTITEIKDALTNATNNPLPKITLIHLPQHEPRPFLKQVLRQPS